MNKSTDSLSTCVFPLHGTTFLAAHLKKRQVAGDLLNNASAGMVVNIFLVMIRISSKPYIYHVLSHISLGRAIAV